MCRSLLGSILRPWWLRSLLLLQPWSLRSAVKYRCVDTWVYVLMYMNLKDGLSVVRFVQLWLLEPWN